MSSINKDKGKASSANKRKLMELLLKSEKRICADCGAPDPKWVSANIGVFISIKYSGVHRSLGTHLQEQTQEFLKLSLQIVSSKSSDSFKDSNHGQASASFWAHV